MLLQLLSLPRWTLRGVLQFDIKIDRNLKVYPLSLTGRIHRIQVTPDVLVGGLGPGVQCDIFGAYQLG
jgi:hypothetical protein